MSDDKRACVAVIIANVNGFNVQNLYDNSINGYRTYSLTRNGNNIILYDYNRNSYISGFLPNLYDYSTSSYIQITIRKNVISGFDYQTSSFFNANIIGRTINIFDGQTSSNYTYSF